MLSKKKFLAMILVFTMTFSYFATATEVVAATNFISIFTGNSEKNNDNIEFEAYLTDGTDYSDSIISDVNNENLALDLKLNVENSGYLKDAIIEIKTKDEQDLNFQIKEDNGVVESSDSIQSLEDNTIKLNKIESDKEEIGITIPIEYVNETYINEEKLNDTFKVVLSGIYVDDEGEENEISKEMELTLGWQDNKTVTVESEISKYVQFGNDGIILQAIIRVDNSNENANSLPVKQTEVTIETPSINGVSPTEVTVIANSTEGTNGKGIGEVEFNEENWTYNYDENLLKINVQNNKKLVTVENEEYLKAEEDEVQEERYYSMGGIDEYVVTYTFRGVALAEELNTQSNIKATVYTLSGTEEGVNTTIAEKNENYILTGQTGNIVSYDIKNETKNLSKAYAYLSKETELISKTAINVSYTDIVEEIYVTDSENYYIDNTGNNIQTDDIYYKEISINQENFYEILGEEGSIQILDAEGNVLTSINKDYVVDDNGNYVFTFQNKVSKITIQTSAPVNIGNLVITNKKAISSISIDKATYANLNSIATATVQKAKLYYVTDLVDLGNCTTKTTLDNTNTDFNLIIDKNSFSTVTTNSNVEIRLELNNDKKTSDIYSDSIFEIEMPKNVTRVNVTNASMIYGEGLDISGVEIYNREDGKIVLKVSITGTQIDFNSGALTNGANIVLNLDIDVDKYTPSLTDAIKAYCYNSQATNYANAVEYTLGSSAVCGCKETAIEYSAPSGVVAINTTYNYNSTGNVLTSIKQGKQLDYIDIYSDAKTATMEIVVMNNNENEISDLSILGRIPFEGITDIYTGEKLGTTMNTKLLSAIISNSENLGEFKIYYSTNENATKDLSDASNGWSEEAPVLEDVKSYLIVPSDENYTLGAKQVLKFTYEYQIAENLNHNEYIYTTFLAYYTNNEESGITSETAKPDLIGLTTGQGPELDLEIISNESKVKELDEFETTVSVTNDGEDIASDIVVTIPVPSNTSIISAEANRDTAEVISAEDGIVVNIPSLSVGTTVDINLGLQVNEIGENDSNIISITSSVVAKDLQSALTVTADDIVIERTELSLTQSIDNDYPDKVFTSGATQNFILYVKNISEKKQANIKVVTTLPEELQYVTGYSIEGNADTGFTTTENSTYDADKNIVTFTIDSLDAKEGRTLHLKLEVGELEQGITEKTVAISSTVSSDDTETYNAKDINVNIGRSSISVIQTTVTPTYVSEGDTIEYTFTLANEGPVSEEVLLTDLVPDGVVVREVSYLIDDEEVSYTMSETENAEVSLILPEDSSTDVTVRAIASTLEGVQELTVTNSGTVATANSDTIESNSVTHIVQVSDRTSDESSSNNGLITSNSGDITKSYKITGTAWLDANENGMRDSNENRMSNITVMLVDSSSGVIKSTTTTNSNGEYTFSGLQNGSYLILFKYDTTLYTVATYRKDGIESNVNSDVITTKIEQNGQKENGAVTDIITISGASVSNIDIGLVESAKFSLELDKSITKITIQNSQGTSTETFDNSKLAKYDIAAKYLSGTTVYIEYTFTVRNNGDLSGYASEIVDYIPSGMTFNSNLNSDWYTGTDGNLYTTALKDKELASGENAQITLVLTKQMTEENTGNVSNTAEISDDYNIYGVSDYNSTPKNKAQDEDDISTADTILTVKTGESLIYVSAIIVCLLLGSAVAFIVYKRLEEVKRKGGV